MGASSPHRAGTIVDRAGADGICFRYNTWHETAMKKPTPPRRLPGLRVSARSDGPWNLRRPQGARPPAHPPGEDGLRHLRDRAPHPLLPHAPPSPRSLLATHGWARRCFAHRQNSLQGEALAPFEKFAAMVQRNRDGITAHCRAEEKVSLGFVEGLNTKIRVIQRRA